MALLWRFCGARTSTMVIVALFSLVLFPPPTDKHSFAAAEDHCTFAVGVAQDIDTLNVFEMILSVSHSINSLVYDTLTTVDKDLSTVPHLASSWEVSGDGRTWTFHLVENATWHDGEPVTAEDVEFTFDLILNNPKEGARWIDYLTGTTADNVTATGAHTLEIATDRPRSTMLSIMIPILPEHIWSAIPADYIDDVDPWHPTYFPDGPIGSGPFRLDSWDTILGEVVLLRNPDYFIGEVNVDEVLFKTFGNEASMMNSLYSGELDIATNVPILLWDETLARPGIEGQEVDSLMLMELGINCATEEWRETFPKASDNLETTNLSVRQAIAMATDKDDIVSSILEGHAEPGVSVIPKATEFWFYNVSEEDKWNYNVIAANDLLNTSGYNRDNDGDGIRENESSGVELDFSLYYRYSYLEDDRAAMAIRDSLAEIGIGVTLNPVSEGLLYNTWLNCEYDLFIWGWQCDVDPDFILSIMTTDQQPVDPLDYSKWGDSFWTNEAYDQMYLDQQSAIDPVERQTIIHNMQEMLYHHCPYVVLYYPKGLYAYSTVRFTDYPDMENHPGLAPESRWFYFEVNVVENPNPPYNVDAGADRTVSHGETHSFTGYAEDNDDPIESLNWSWTFVEPDWSVHTLYGQTVNYTFEIPGTVTVTLTVRDPASSSDSDGLLVYVLSPPPPETIASISGEEGMNGWYVSSVEVTLNATAVAGVTGTYYSVNSGEWQEYTEPFVIGTEGENTLEYYSIDSCGTNETPNSTEVSIDIVASASSITLAGTSGTEGWYRSSVEVTIDVTDASSGVQETSYALDDGEWTTYDVEFTVGAEGSHSLLVRSEDIAGNIEEAQLEEFNIDLTDPELMITSPAADASTSSSVISWTCSDNMGISSTEISVDSQAWESVDMADELSFNYVLDVSDGKHDIQIRATDLAGNEVVESISFTLDTTAPTLLILTPSEGAAIRGGDVEITWESSDDILVDSTEINVDGSGWTAVTPSGVDTLSLELGHGEHTVQLRVTDSAGNQKVSSVTFEVNSSALSFGGPYYGLPLVVLIAAIIAAVAVLGKTMRGRGLI